MTAAAKPRAKKINREETLRALHFASVALGKQGAGMCFRFAGGTVSAWNDDIYASANVDVEWEGVILAKKIITDLEKHQDTLIAISGTTSVLTVRGADWVSNSRVEAITGLGSQYEITLPAEESWVELSGGFLDAAEAVGRAASRDKDGAFKMRCVNLTPGYLEAFDGGQYARCDVRTGLAESVLILWESLKHCIGVGASHICLQDGFLHFKNKSGVHLACRIFSEPYPDLSKVMGGVAEAEDVQLPTGISDALKACMTHIEDDDQPLEVNIAPGWLYIGTKSESGDYTRRSQLSSYAGEPLSFRMHPRLFKAICDWGKIRILDASHGAKRICFKQGRLIGVAFTSPPKEPDSAD